MPFGNAVEDAQIKQAWESVEVRPVIGQYGLSHVLPDRAPSFVIACLSLGA